MLAYLTLGNLMFFAGCAAASFLVLRLLIRRGSPGSVAAPSPALPDASDVEGEAEALALAILRDRESERAPRIAAAMVSDARAKLRPNGPTSP